MKQDVNMTRKTTDLETKYELTKVPKTAKEVEEIKKEIVIDSSLSISSTHAVENRVITYNLSNKVNRETGKGLSTNDFDNTYKQNVDDNTTARHTHTNQAILDNITSVPSATILYENSSGSTTDITLSQSVGLFDFIDIVFGNASSIYDTRRVYDPNGKSISLMMGSCAATSFANRTENDSISGTTITRGTRHKFSLNSTGVVSVVNNASITDADKLLIYKVIGYKN